MEAEWRNELTAAAADASILSAAFDGPLRPGLDGIGRYRSAERMLTRKLGRKIGKPGQSSSPVGRELNAAANEYARFIAARPGIGLARHLHAIERASIAEAFPSSFLGVMLPSPTAVTASRSSRSDLFFQHLAETNGLQALIGYLLPEVRSTASWMAVTDHDERAALVCALTALCVAAGEYIAVGDPDDGWIILPPRRFIHDWAWQDLLENADGGAWLATGALTAPERRGVVSKAP